MKLLPYWIQNTFFHQGKFLRKNGGLSSVYIYVQTKQVTSSNMLIGAVYYDFLQSNLDGPCSSSWKYSNIIEIENSLQISLSLQCKIKENAYIMVLSKNKWYNWDVT